MAAKKPPRPRRNRFTLSTSFGTRLQRCGACTQPALLAAWLMDNDIRAVVGHRFTFKARPIPGWDGTVHCEVLEVDAPSNPSCSWRGGSGASAIDTVLTFRLRATPAGGAQLTLEHDGLLPENSLAFAGLPKGWRGKVRERLHEILAREP